MDTNNERMILKLKEIQYQIDELNIEVAKSCACENHLEIKIRKFGGGIHYVEQCNTCGAQRGGSLKKAHALQLLIGTTPRDFDPSINEQYRLNRQLANEKISKLSNERIQLKRLLNIQPAQNGIHAAVDEHYIKSASDLSLYVDDLVTQYGMSRAVRLLVQETVRLRKRENEELKQKTNRFSTEAELKAWFEEFFSKDFIISSEVNGRHLAENVSVRIDYFLKARNHLVEEGFDPKAFGVEVKYFRQEEKFTHKTSRGIWQTISYNDCEFDLPEGPLKPKFCLIFSNLSFPDELNIANCFGTEYENDKIQWRGMLHLANHANIGCLNIRGSRDQHYGWEMRFGGGVYFCCYVSKQGITYKKSNENVINKIRVGNF